MNEDAARQVLLVRAVEGADADRALITESDREHAARAAGELARWAASERGVEPTPEVFVARRAELLAGKLREREPGLARAAGLLTWRPWLGVALPLAALLAGLLGQHLGDRHHVNVLAFPLMAIVAWNLVMYAVLAARAVMRLGGAPSPAGLRAAVAGAARRGPARLRGRAADAYARYAADWLRASGPLLTARAARTLHLAAALLALGAVGALYIQGLVFEYRAGWESTFLDATAVHGVLSTLLGPAARFLGTPFPTVAEIDAIRLTRSDGDDAARWIHWYALTVGGLVIVPRLVLAAAAAGRAGYLRRRFPVALDDPYFRRLLGGFAGRPARLRVVPYSYTVDEAGAAGLEAVARAVLGDAATVGLRPSVPFGSESAAADGLRRDAEASPTLALFNLASTPEHENHGAFVAALRSAIGRRVVALVDEAPYVRRFGAQSDDRRQERRTAWTAFGAAHDLPVVFADLAAPDLRAAAAALEPVLADTP